MQYQILTLEMTDRLLQIFRGFAGRVKTRRLQNPGLQRTCNFHSSWFSSVFSIRKLTFVPQARFCAPNSKQVFEKEPDSPSTQLDSGAVNAHQRLTLAPLFSMLIGAYRCTCL
jgi:hypothetical protein